MRSLVPKHIFDWYLLYLAGIWGWIELLSAGNLLSVATLRLFTLGVFGGIFLNRKTMLKTWKTFQWNRWRVTIAGLFAITFVQGLIGAPNTTDALVYHLTRVVFWLQHQSVRQSAIITAHDYMPPLSGYSVMYWWSWFDNDRLVFLSQWLAGGITVLVAWRMARRFVSAPQADQIALAVASIPMLLYQSASTQIDLLVSSIFMVTLLKILEWRDEPNFRNTWWIALGFGLGVATKATFVLWGVVLIGLLLESFWRGTGRQRIQLVLAGMISGVFQLRWMAQNWYFFGSLLGIHSTPTGILHLTNEAWSLGGVLSNVLRNTFMHLPALFLAPTLTQILTRSLSLLGISLNDPATTWYGSIFSWPFILFPQEDIISMPWHLVFIVVAGVWGWRHRSKVDRVVTQLYGLGWLSWVVFSVVLKWQPYHARLHLTFFILMTVLAGIMLHREKWLPYFSGGCAIVAGLLIMLNVSRPLLSYQPFESLIRPLMPAGSRVPTSIFTTSRKDQLFHAWGAEKEVQQALVAQLPDQATVQLTETFAPIYPVIFLGKEANKNIVLRGQAEAADWLVEEPTASVAGQWCWLKDTLQEWVCLKQR